MTQARLFEVLLVEDNPGDAYLTLDALQGSLFESTIGVVENGDDALRYLRREGPAFANAPRPDLVLLDLNLPRRNGHEMLESIRSDPSTSMIPVIVLTSSDREADIARAYGLRANCYVTKPVQVDEFRRAIRSLSDFWFDVVRLPPPEES